VSERRPSAVESFARVPRLADVLGQDSVISILRQSLARKTLHHALLLVGPEGVGKRTTAVALAAELLCSSGREEACGECLACRQVASGTHADLRRESFPFDDKGEVRERVSIDQVRSVQVFLGGQALARGRKIAIFEEAQALTEDAQNALLKTLEEPPRGSLIVLVCHNTSKLLPTVRSRCQRLAFAPLDRATVEAILRARPGRPPEDARFLALHSQGSLVFAADAERLREARATASRFLAAARSGRYAEIVAASKDVLSSPRGVPLELKMTLDLLRQRLRARAGLAEGGQLTPPDETGSLGGALQAMEAAYVAVADLGRNANRSLTVERMALRIAACQD
jgi:DNA polymerase-3 subunit delta'